MSQTAQNNCTEKIEIYQAPVEVITLNYTWSVKVSDLRYALAVQALYSNQFKSLADECNVWCLQLKNSSCNEYFDIALNLWNGTPVRYYYKISLTTSRGDHIKTRKFEVNDVVPGGISIFQRLLKRNKIFHLALNENVNVVCELHYTCNKFNFPEQRQIKQLKKVQQEISQNFFDLVKNETFADVNVSVDGKTFRLHKAILSARSEVFAAMFKHDMKENDTNCVKIIELKHEVFSEMVNFIYTGQAPNCKEVAMDLLAAADKYALKGLKETCEHKLMDNLSIATSVETLIFADLYNSNELKSKAIGFINAHVTEVMKTESWQNMKKSHPYLAIEAFEKFAQSFKIL